MSRIVSVWLPAWPIERKARQAPGSVPSAEPFALVEHGRHGLEVSAVNEAAFKAGIRPGTRLADARAVLPTLATAPAEGRRDARALAALVEWLGRYGPARNIDGTDGAWIDVTGVPHLFGGEACLCTDLAERLHRLGITARIGLAGSLAAAHALARFARPTHASARAAISPAGTDKPALAALPVAALRLAPEARELLVRLGLKRIGQLYGLPRPTLAARFREAPGSRRREADRHAASVLMRLDQALGLLAEPRPPLSPAPEAHSRLAFADPLVTAAGIETAVERLSADVEAQLAAKCLGARRFRLALYRSDGTVATVAVGTSLPGRDARHIRSLLGEKLVSIDAGFGVDVTTLEAGRIEPLPEHQNALAAGTSPADSFASLGVLVDRLVGRLGAGRVVIAQSGASHLPERAEAWIPAITALPRASPKSIVPPGPAGSSPTSPSSRAPILPPRPPFLLAPPEPIAVIAEVPEGAPQHFVWRRVPRRILRSEGPERIAPEWWRHIGMPAPLPGTRDYYRLEDPTGARYWVFRDGLYGRGEEDLDESEEDVAPRWFLHGLFA